MARPTHLSNGRARARPVRFADIPGWAEDDALAAFGAFIAGARHLADTGLELRAAKPAGKALVEIARKALGLRQVSAVHARAFFEREFEPFDIVPEEAQPFFTGYFEPEVKGSLVPGVDFTAPVMGRPAGLVTLVPGETLPDMDAVLTSAMRQAGTLVPAPDRAAIEAGALAGQGLELLWLRDRVALFIIQVQGSARVRLQNGRTIRLRYDGRNGWPYTSIGRFLIDSGAIAADGMSLEALMGWLRAHPDEADAVMRRNRSYVFFVIDDKLASEDGPIGGAGVPLTAGRSIAVDRSIWSYGLPFFIDVERPQPEGGVGCWRRLMIAQDTGTAIVGPGRVDIYFGAGEAAGSLAGRQRHHGRLFALMPRGMSAAHK